MYNCATLLDEPLHCTGEDTCTCRIHTALAETLNLLEAGREALVSSELTFMNMALQVEFSPGSTLQMQVAKVWHRGLTGQGDESAIFQILHLGLQAYLEKIRQVIDSGDKREVDEDWSNPVDMVNTLSALLNTYAEGLRAVAETAARETGQQPVQPPGLPAVPRLTGDGRLIN